MYCKPILRYSVQLIFFNQCHAHSPRPHISPYHRTKTGTVNLNPGECFTKPLCYLLNRLVIRAIEQRQGF
ncbi:MAG: hypothetical protein HW399_1174 [Dehalococcoidia bacterium]|nr:hypothetical protein [Dehalococcoidia bacterium]